MRRPAAQSFEDLVVWQKAHALVLAIYRLSRQFPREETYGLTAQVRRAAVSVPANIAEGFKRRGRAEKARFLNISQGSLEEARYYVRLGRDLCYHEDETLSSQFDEVGRMLNSYTQSILRVDG
jgi:four helix bundle protein